MDNTLWQYIKCSKKLLILLYGLVSQIQYQISKIMISMTATYPKRSINGLQNTTIMKIYTTDIQNTNIYHKCYYIYVNYIRYIISICQCIMNKSIPAYHKNIKNIKKAFRLAYRTFTVTLHDIMPYLTKYIIWLSLICSNILYIYHHIQYTISLINQYTNHVTLDSKSSWYIKFNLNAYQNPKNNNFALLFLSIYHNEHDTS